MVFFLLGEDIFFEFYTEKKPFKIKIIGSWIDNTEINISWKCDKNFRLIERLMFLYCIRSLLLLTYDFCADLNTQLEDLPLIVRQAGQLSVDNQNVPTAGESHWHNAFVTLKSDFTELEKKCPEALNAAQSQSGSDKRLQHRKKNQKQHPWYFRNDTVHLALKKPCAFIYV